MQHPLNTYITKSVFDVLFFKVGPTWGRKMVKGYMASGGITAGDKRVERALSVVSRLYQVQRNSNTANETNPFPYHADYFGHKSVHVMAIVERLRLLQRCDAKSKILSLAWKVQYLTPCHNDNKFTTTENVPNIPRERRAPNVAPRPVRTGERSQTFPPPAPRGYLCHLEWARLINSSVKNKNWKSISIFNFGLSSKFT